MTSTTISRIQMTSLVSVILVMILLCGRWLSNQEIPVPHLRTSTVFGTTFASRVVVSPSSVFRGRCEEAALRPETFQTCHGRQLTGGYVLALMNAEQQSGGSANLMSLQCWAATMRMVVVEYFMPASIYFVPDEILKGTASPKQVVRIRDLFNIDYWNKYSRKQCFAPLVSWKEFLCNAPREVILVHIAYQRHMGNSTLRDCPPGKKYQDDFKQKYTGFFQAHAFRIVREVCIKTSQHLSTQEFNSAILGRKSTSKVTVIIDSWRGAALNRDNRVAMNDTKCDRFNYLSLKFSNPSSQLSEDVRQYREKVLQNEEYSAVMVRLEHALSELKTEPLTTWSPSKCLKGTIPISRHLKKRYDVNKIFWSLDVGQYGSIGYNRRYNGIAEEVLHFMQEQYNVSYLEVEASVTGISTMRRAGYIASLQQNIAARAKCLVLIGGGTFQAHTMALYKRFHKGAPCVIKHSKNWLKKQCHN